MKFSFTRIFGGILAAVMVCALFGVLRFAYADFLGQTDDVGRVRAALQITPENAAYWFHWADLTEAGGASGLSGLRRAADLDPYNANIWIAAGLKAEMNGDYSQAEQNLLSAAQSSRQYEPRWALANYYFRREDAPHFWFWAKSALEWAYQDPAPLFDLCWRMQPDADVILARGIPEQPKVLRDYLGYLLITGRFDPAVQVAEHIARHVSDEDRGFLLWYIGAMLDKHYWSGALSAWNALCLRNLIHYPPLDPGKGHVLTNGTLSSEPLGVGFDWRVTKVTGLSSERDSFPPSLRFDFDGQEPENFEVVSQFIPVKPGQRYGLHFAVRTESIPANAGLHWRITDASTGTEIPADRASLSSQDWMEQGFAFTVPPDVQMTRLALQYRRETGTVRIEGSLFLKDVRLECLP